MKKVLLTLLAFGVSTAFAATAPQTKIATFERPTEASIKKSITTLYKALNTKNEESKDRLVADARKLLNTRKVEHIFPGAVYVDGVKQFEDGEDSSYDFEATCFKGTAEDVANLINIALEQNLWAGDEESVKSAEVKGAKVLLKVHDGPNDENLTFEISACK